MSELSITDEKIRHMAHFIIDFLDGPHPLRGPIYHGLCHDLEVLLRQRRREDPDALSLDENTVRSVRFEESIDVAEQAWNENRAMQDEIARKD